MNRSIKSIKRQIRKWWMLVTAPTGLVKLAGGYYVLTQEYDNDAIITAVPVSFTGLLGWDVIHKEPSRYFTNMKLAKQKSIEARFFIEFME